MERQADGNRIDEDEALNLRFGATAAADMAEGSSETIIRCLMLVAGLQIKACPAFIA